MEFGPVHPADCSGAILAHSVDAGGKRFKKGRVLSPGDSAALMKAGVSEVIVCRLSDNDVHEDEAANKLAGAVSGAGLRMSEAFTGRVNLIAEEEGILVYDPDTLDAVNVVDEGITLAALPPFSRIVPRQMAATAKIIPFGVARSALEDACPEKPIFRIAPFKAKRLGLIQTELPTVKPTVLDKTERVMENRAASVGSALLPPMRCPHREVDLAETLKAAIAQGAEIVTVIGASAIVDRKDVIPAAIETCGGDVRHFGMPVDPGNLLLLGDINGVPIIGAPGCVRSPKPNGYDWVLERLSADLPVDRQAIMHMGAGGFLKEIPSRPLPRAETEPVVHSTVPHIAGLLLAAGQSRRMGSQNKLLAELDAKPMVRHAAETLLQSDAEGLTVVTGHETDAVRAVLSDLPAHYTFNPDYAQGLAETVKRGIAALPDTAEGALICLGDMPRLRVETLNKLIAAFDPIEGRSICVPVYQGKRGNPVLFARRFFPEILELSGDTGAKALIGAYEDHAVEVLVDDPGVLLDLDTPEALNAERNR